MRGDSGRMKMLEGKTVAMTGGGGALGRCYGLAMAKAGAAIAVSDVKLAAAQATADAIVQAGGRAIAVQTDVIRAAAFEQLLDRAEAAFGPLDVLLNIAGIFPRRALVDLPEEEWDAVIQVHLKGTFAPSRHAAAHWRELFKVTGAPVKSIATWPPRRSATAGAPPL